MQNYPANIYLVGLMGAGKTTVGRTLAKRLGWRFFDCDHEIEARTGVSIPTIFEIEGEAGFRRRETQMLHELTAQSAIVMATGGGAVIAPENRRRLKETGFVVYLDVPPETLYQRTRGDRNRPLLQVEDPLARLGELHAARAPFYREIADLTINSASNHTLATVERLAKEYESRLTRNCSEPTCTP